MFDCGVSVTGRAHLPSAHMVKGCKRAVQHLLQPLRTLTAAWLPYWQPCLFSFRVAAVVWGYLHGTRHVRQGVSSTDTNANHTVVGCLAR
jgi:hypothetical protein